MAVLRSPFSVGIWSSDRGRNRNGSKTVSLRVLRGIRVPKMTLDEQDSVACILDNLSSNVAMLEILYQQKLTVLTELKRSILQKAFAGELTADYRSEVIIPQRTHQS